VDCGLHHARLVIDRHARVGRDDAIDAALVVLPQLAGGDAARL
jgi:hypothetical protein